MYGLVLEGGGARGAYEIGAYKALMELGIDIKGITGTSIGALNGAIIVQGDWQKAYELWYNITPSQLFDIEEEYLEKLAKLELTKDNIIYFIEKVKSILNNKGIDISPIKNFLITHIKEEKVRKAEMDFGIITFSLTDLKPLELFLEDIPKGKLIDYLLASSYLPAFKPERMDGKYFLDGGFYDNLPVKMLVDRGYNKIIAIRLNSMGRIRKVDTQNISIKYIKPKEDLGRILDFSQKRARYNLKLGYYDTLKSFKNLKGKKFYILPKNDENFCINVLLNFNKEKLFKIGHLFGFKDVPVHRLLFEIILPRLAVLLDLSEKASYEEILTSLMEEIAIRLNLERFKIYEFEELIWKIKEIKKTYHKKRNFNIPEFMKKQELLSRVMKDQILDEVISILLD